MQVTPDDSKRELYKIIDQLVQKKIDVNRKYIDEILEKMQEHNRSFFLERMRKEIEDGRASLEKGDRRGAVRHKVLAETYRAIVERCL